MYAQRMELCKHKEEVKSVSEVIIDSAMDSSLEQLITSSKSPWTPKTPLGKLSPSKGSPKHDGCPNSGRHDQPTKAGSDGTSGGLVDNQTFCDPKHLNYDICEEKGLLSCSKQDLEEFKKKARVIVEEYFTADDIMSTANELKDLGCPSYHHYFVKKLVSMAMDMHDREKEMSALLLSTLYAQFIHPQQVYKGFCELLESADDLSVDIPDAVNVLSIFVARAIVDEILPPAFLNKQSEALPPESKGMEIIKRVSKSYLSAPLRTENLLRKWGGGKNTTVSDVKIRINDLLMEYVVSGDKAEARRCIKDLNVPFFHHEIVKQALMLAMERRSGEGRILDLLKVAHEEGAINASQMSKGFNRLIDHAEDLSLDIPSARNLLQSLISKAASEGWLCASSLRSLGKQVVEDDIATKNFKVKAAWIIKEYFLTGDVLEVISSLESLIQYFPATAPPNAVFVKRLITSAMEGKNREKEMASMLLAWVRLPDEDVALGFRMLIESVEDSALDIPGVVEDLGMFLARAVVDEVLPPSSMDEVECLINGESMGGRVVQLSRSALRARLSGERILRCWGSSGGGRMGSDINEVKEKIMKLLEEFDTGGDVREACRCINDLGMPFFHHEVVKKALVGMMEKKNDHRWGLLRECWSIGLITPDQMSKGFGRVADVFEDLVLDVPDAEEQWRMYVDRANKEGCLPLPNFSHY